MTLGGLGLLYLTRIGVNSPNGADILPALVATGIGLGLVISTSISNATLGVEPNDAGVASATVSASQQVGASLGTALLSTIAASAAAHYLASDPHAAGLPAHAAVHGYTVGFTWAAAIFAVGAIVSAPPFTAAGRSAEPSRKMTSGSARRVQKTARRWMEEQRKRAGPRRGPRPSNTRPGRADRRSAVSGGRRWWLRRRRVSGARARTRAQATADRNARRKVSY
jgi:hypothetical protein